MWLSKRWSPDMESQIDSKSTCGKFLRDSAQFGGGLLPAIAALGVIMVMTQGTIFYKAKTSSRFLADERNKIMAQQAAEAGVESAIADIGSRRVIVTSDMEEYVTASDVEIGSGTFTTTLTTLAMGPNGDTVSLNSRGTVSKKDKQIAAKLRLHNFMDTSRVALAVGDTDTVQTIAPRLVFTDVTTIQDPYAMPALDATAAYAACMASSAKKCDVCHLPGGDVTKANVINISKSAIGTHISHHGDYVTTDGTCDIYQPKTTSVPHTVYDTTYAYNINITYDTTMAIDTVVKVQVLSWR
jgi:Tfp pilus assembly protein PilX